MISNAHTLSIRFLVVIATVTFAFAGVSPANAADIAALQERAQRGDVDAQIDLAEAYMDSDSGNAAEAANLYRRAAEMGAAQAQTKLGILYLEGRGVKKDAAEAIKWFRRAAAQDNTEAQCYIGEVYFYGIGVTQDRAEAVDWFRKAADKGDAEAEFRLGGSYADGEGVEQNYTEAVEWNRKAAEQGHPTAQYYLGREYYTGQGVEKDLAEAVKWFRKAAEKGNQEAKWTLSMMEKETPGGSSGNSGTSQANLVITVKQALENHDWRTLTKMTVDRLVNYFDHEHVTNAFIEQDMQNDSRTYAWVHSTAYPDTFSHEVSEQYSSYWSGPMLYDSINVYTEAQEKNGKLHKATTRLTVGYVLDSAGRPVIYSLTLKVL